MAHLEISSSYSKCSECGGNASPYESKHILGGPYSGWRLGSSLADTNGCKVDWEYAQVTYSVSLETAQYLIQEYSHITLKFDWIY